MHHWNYTPTLYYGHVCKVGCLWHTRTSLSYRSECLIFNLVPFLFIQQITFNWNMSILWDCMAGMFKSCYKWKKLTRNHDIYVVNNTKTLTLINLSYIQVESWKAFTVFCTMNIHNHVKLQLYTSPRGSGAWPLNVLL